MQTGKILLTVKSLLIACVIAGGLTLTATEAAAGKDCLPGCDCPAGPGPAGGSNSTGTGEPNSSGRFGGVLGAMENHADTVRVRNKAFGRKIIKQTDNALGMTCFDKAMAQTSKLGKIFSDERPAAPPENKSVFGTSSYPNQRKTESLLQGIMKTVEDPTARHAGNFTLSLSSLFLGAGDLRFLRDIVRTLQQALAANSPLSIISSILGGAGLNECSRLGKLWGNASSLGDVIPGFKPLVGSGSESNVPYLTFSQLLNRSAPGLDADNAMLKELENPANSTILKRAADDFTGGGALSGAGNSSTWPSVPQITSTTATTTEIIGLMN